MEYREESVRGERELLPASYSRRHTKSQVKAAKLCDFLAIHLPTNFWVDARTLWADFQVDRTTSHTTNRFELDREREWEEAVSLKCLNIILCFAFGGQENTQVSGHIR